MLGVEYVTYTKIVDTVYITCYYCYHWHKFDKIWPKFSFFWVNVRSGVRDWDSPRGIRTRVRLWDLYLPDTTRKHPLSSDRIPPSVCVHCKKPSWSSFLFASIQRTLFVMTKRATLFFLFNNLGTFCNTKHNVFLRLNKELTRVEFEPTTSGLTCRRSTNWASPILAVSLFCQCFWQHWLYTSLGAEMVFKGMILKAQRPGVIMWKGFETPFVCIKCYIKTDYYYHYYYYH